MAPEVRPLVACAAHSGDLGSKDTLDAFAQLQASVTESIPEGEIRKQATKEVSPTRQIRQHVAASVVVFIVSFVLTFYLLNGRI
jgi:hypothetical protein